MFLAMKIPVIITEARIQSCEYFVMERSAIITAVTVKHSLANIFAMEILYL